MVCVILLDNICTMYIRILTATFISLWVIDFNLQVIITVHIKFKNIMCSTVRVGFLITRFFLLLKQKWHIIFDPLREYIKYITNAIIVEFENSVLIEHVQC